MKGGILTPLTLGAVSCLLSPAIASSACNFQTFLSLRDRWAADDEPCQQKLTFDLWLSMKADGSAADPDAQHVLAECTNLPAVHAVQLSIDEAWEYVPANEDCGAVVDQGKSSAAFACKNAADLEAMCSDAGISRVSRISTSSSGFVQRKPNIRGAIKSRRHLQSTTSEAVIAHEVDVLIAGLQELGCVNTMGDGQNLCVMSDSFNGLGNAAQLQESGDLPEVQVVKEYPIGFDDLPSDEGSAMVELAYDIAPNALYKFNTGSVGFDAFAADVTTLSTTHACDVIVDDLRYDFDPTFRDGSISEAIDSAVEDNDIVYFTAAGNSGNGVRFAFNLECTDALFGTEISRVPCTTGVATHVFDDAADGVIRYLVGYESFIADGRVIMQWDDDVGAAGSMNMALWTVESDTLELVELAPAESPEYAAAVFSPSAARQYYVSVHMTEERADTAVEMHLVGVSTSAGAFQGASDTALYGSACTTKAISVAAINHAAANGGSGGAFSDPELSPVERFSSRGGCNVRNNAGVLEERRQPVTTAANRLATSTPGFGVFAGTSAAAPVAAAIATLIRAACAPEKVVGFDEMMEMFTNDAYTIDYPADEDTTGEMWGVEAGYGIVSGAQMLAWVATNCALACPGSVAPVPTPAPTDDIVRVTTAPVPVPTPAPTDEAIPVTTAPVSVPTPAPTDDIVRITTAPVPVPTPAPSGDILPITTAPVPVPTPVPTDDVPVTTEPVQVSTPAPTDDVVRVTTAPVPRPTPAPTNDVIPVTTAPESAPTPAPIDDDVPVTTAPVPVPTLAPTDDVVPITTAPVPIPTPDPFDDDVPVTTTPVPGLTPAPTDDVVLATTAPVPVPTPAPTDDVEPVTTAPVAPVPVPTPAPVDDGEVEAGTKTSVTVTATGYDPRPSGEQGCGMNGCLPELTRDGIVADEESRWSCKENIVFPGVDNCELEFEFDEPQDIATVQVAFWRAGTRTRRLKAKVNGATLDSFESSSDSEYTLYEIDADDVKRLTLESIGLDKDEWISILEVRFLVAA